MTNEERYRHDLAELKKLHKDNGYDVKLAAKFTNLEDVWSRIGHKFKSSKGLTHEVAYHVASDYIGYTTYFIGSGTYVKYHDEVAERFCVDENERISLEDFQKEIYSAYWGWLLRWERPEDCPLLFIPPLYEEHYTYP